MHRKKKMPALAGVNPTGEEHVGVSVRKITNGYLMHQSHTKPDGTYHSSETYHPTKPTIATVAPVKAMRKPATATLKRKRTSKKG